MEIKKTSEEWQKELLDIKIIDPDGWDRTNFIWSFFVEEITKEEFDKRVSVSTCMYNKINK